MMVNRPNRNVSVMKSFIAREHYSFDGFVLDADAETLTRDGVGIHLAPKPFRALLYMVRHRDRLVSREELIGEIWQDTIVEYDQGLGFLIREIRSALGDRARSPMYLETVPRRGFRFVASVEQPSSRRGAIAAGVVATVLIVASITFGRTSSERVVLPSDSLAAEAFSQGGLYLQRNLRVNDLQNAIRLFSLTIERDSSFAPAYALRSVARVSLLWEHGWMPQLDSAQSDLEQALRLDRSDPSSQLAAGYMAYYGARDYETAVDHFGQAVEGDPDNLLALTGLGYVLRRVGRWTEAVEVLRKAYDSDNESFEVAYALATTLQQMREYEAAELYLSRTIALEPDDFYGYQLAAINALNLGTDTAASRARILAWPAFTPSRLVNSEMLSRSLLTSLIGDPAELDLADSRANALRFYYVKGQLLEIVGDSVAAALSFDSAVAYGRSFGVTADDATSYGGAQALRLAYSLVVLGKLDEGLALADSVRLRSPVWEDTYAGPSLKMIHSLVLLRAGYREAAAELVAEVLSRPGWLTPGIVESDPYWSQLTEMPVLATALGGN